MNRQRRKLLREIQGELEMITIRLSAIANDEDKAIFNSPESVRMSDQYVHMRSNVTKIDKSIAHINTALALMEDTIV